jgi:hypothetical protein
VLLDDAILVKAHKEFGAVSLVPFWTNPERTLRRGGLYVAALNPGGDPEQWASQRREAPLDGPQRAADRDDWCKVLDEKWGTKYQANVIELMQRALPGGPDALREAFCTDAVFARGSFTRDTDNDGLWAVCKPWHARWLDILRPNLILCLGNHERWSAYAWLKNLLTDFRETARIKTYGKFSVKIGEGRLSDRTVAVVSTPHPARWLPSDPRCREGVDRVREVLHASAPASEVPPRAPISEARPPNVLVRHD